MVHNLIFNNDKPKYDFMQNSVKTMFQKDCKLCKCLLKVPEA